MGADQGLRRNSLQRRANSKTSARCFGSTRESRARLGRHSTNPLALEVKELLRVTGVLEIDIFAAIACSECIDPVSRPDSGGGGAARTLARAGVSGLCLSLNSVMIACLNLGAAMACAPQRPGALGPRGDSVVVVSRAEAPGCAKRTPSRASGAPASGAARLG